MKSPLNTLAVIGLALGAVFGLAGTFVGEETLRNTCWGIDSLGLIMAASLLCLKFFRSGNEIVAGGFMVFAIGEAVILSGTASGLPQSIASFAAGTGMWATGLLLISLPRAFPLWVRAVGAVAGILFFIVSFSTFGGHPLSALSTPLPFFAYPFLVLTFIGWILTLVREA